MTIATITTTIHTIQNLLRAMETIRRLPIQRLKSGDEQEEGRDGILNLRDTESRSSKLERLKSSRSTKDPNLVSLLDLVPRRTLGLAGPAPSPLPRSDSPTPNESTASSFLCAPSALSSHLPATNVIANPHRSHGTVLMIRRT